MRTFLIPLLLFFFSAQPIFAAYLASDVLGQRTATNVAAYTTSVGLNSLINSTGLNNIFDSVLDETHHRLFVADYTNGRVLVYNLDANNDVVDYTADYVLGSPDFTTTAATSPTQSLMVNPVSVAYDSINDYLFVVDSFTRILVFDVASITNGEAAINVIGQIDFTTITGATSQSKLSGTVDIDYDTATKYLYVPDSNNSRVLVFDLSGGISNGMNAFKVLGQTNFTNSSPNRGGSAAQNTLSGAYSVAVDSAGSRLFVNDRGNNRVLMYDLSGGITDGMNASNVLGQANFTSVSSNRGGSAAQNTLSTSYGIAYKSNKLYIADSGNVRVLRYDVSSITDGMNAENVLGQSLYTTFSLLKTAAGFANTPTTIAVSSSDKIFVCESFRILIFDGASITDGESAVNVVGQTTREGTITFTKSNANNAYGDDGFNLPFSAAIDTVHHRLFVGERTSSRVLVFNLNSSNTLEDHVADYVIGQADFGATATTASATVLSLVFGVEYDSKNNRLFVSNGSNGSGSRVSVFDVSTITNGMAASYTLGQPDHTTITTGTTQSKMGSVNAGLLNTGKIGMEYDAANERLFVADNRNSRVLVFNVNPSSISTGMNTSNVLGQSLFTTSTSTTTQTGFGTPNDVAYDASRSRLFVSTGQNRILVYDLSSGITDGMAASNVIGQTGFTTSSSGSTDSALSGQTCVEYDATNNLLYVTDRVNKRILIFDTVTVTDGESAVAVIGQDTTSGNSATGPTQSALATGARDAMLDESNNRLYVVDSNNNRVLIFDLISNLPSTLNEMVDRVPFSQNLSVTSTQGTVSYSMSGNLPSDWTVSTGTLTGTPFERGEYSFTVTASDASTWGAFPTRKTYTATLAPRLSASSSGGGGSSGIKVKNENNNTPSNPAPTPSFAFTTVLKKGNTNSEVKELQKFLNKNGFIVAQKGPGSAGNETNYFGPATAAAVKKFQEKYREEILDPLKLKQGTGMFGEATRTKANSMLRFDLQP